jgi:hypothetical protein
MGSQEDTGERGPEEKSGDAVPGRIIRIEEVMINLKREVGGYCV